MCGSYYIDCDVLAWNVPYTHEWYSVIEKILRKVPDKHGKEGAVIRYYDDFVGEYITCWVEKDIVKTPPISEWLGM
jgi:hypothetical protein